MHGFIFTITLFFLVPVTVMGLSVSATIDSASYSMKQASTSSDYLHIIELIETTLKTVNYSYHSAQEYVFEKNEYGLEKAISYHDIKQLKRIHLEATTLYKKTLNSHPIASRQVST